MKSIVVALVLVGCAAHEEAPLETPAPHGYSHVAKAKADPFAADRARANAELDTVTADEMKRSAPGVAPSTTVEIKKPPPEASRPDPFEEHKKQCRATVTERTNAALATLRDYDSSKAQITTKCKALEPKCLFNGSRHVIGCKGMSADDANFVESVCAVLPQVVAIDESKDCFDVDRPVLIVHYGDGSSSDVKQRWLAELKAQ